MAAHPSGSATRFAAVSLDCADPAALALFYLKLLGGEMLWHTAYSVGIRVPGVLMAMQHIEGYHPPAWPGSSMVHLDLTADGNLEDAVARAVVAGAVQVDNQPDPQWRILLDPAGHPFCVTTVTRPPAVARRR